MKNKFARTGAIAALVCTQLVLSGCQSGGTTARPRASVPAPTATPRAQYIDLADRIAARKTTVWVEADLVKAWQKRGQRYDDVLNIAVKLASRPGVVGIKIADELGYHDGIDTPQQAGKFLADEIAKWSKVITTAGVKAEQ